MKYLIWLRRLMGAVAMLLALAVFIGCVAAIVGVWKVQKDVSRRIDSIADQLDVGFQRAAAATRTVHGSIETIRADMQLVKENQDSKASMTYLRTVTDRIRFFSEGLAGVTAMLRTLPELPFVQAGRIDSEKLGREAKLASELSATADKARALLGGEEDVVPVQDVAEAVNQVEGALQKCDTVLDDYQRDLDAARAALPDQKAEVHRWLTLVAVGATCLGVLVAISQVSLFLGGWRWCRGGES